MGVCEDMECGVCYQAYTRWDRIPRQLHCGHALCTLCLRRIARPLSFLLALRCPFCRWTTCIGPHLSVREGLLVHTQLWDQISEEEEEEEEEAEEGCENKEKKEREEEEEEAEEGKREGRVKQIRLPAHQSKWPSLQVYRLHLQVPSFLKRISSNLQRTFRPGHQTCRRRNRS